MVHSGFRNFCFRNRFVTEMLGTACGLSRNRVLDVLCGICKKLDHSYFRDYFRGQAWLDLWPGMANVCYCHKLNNMLNMKLCDICVIKMEIIICIGLYD